MTARWTPLGSRRVPVALRRVSLGRRRAVGVEIQLPEAPLVLVLGRKGYLMCGYLNLEAAERFHAAAAIVRGVRNVREILEKGVWKVTRRARRLGVRPGIPGREALKRFL
ncbi:MAG: DUF1805 domain-containing protein [Elusimicrobia bacterium]|nr:DUF1805 domain-containing protein [Elusimicrobiota bacterium]